MNTLLFSIGGLPLPKRKPLWLGDRHPSTAGVIGLDVEFDHDTIIRADIQPGHLHRAAEKLFEVRDYRSMIMLADRHDWLSSFTGELVVTGAVVLVLVGVGVLLLGGDGPVGLGLLLAGSLVVWTSASAAALAGWAWRGLGGVTGDVLGAAAELSVLAGLLGLVLVLHP